MKGLFIFMGSLCVVAIVFCVLMIVFTPKRRDPTPEEEQQANAMHAKNIVGDIKYAKDPRTGLCFGLLDRCFSNGHGGFCPTFITVVPCVPAVEALLINKPVRSGCDNSCKKNYQPERMEQK